MWITLKWKVTHKSNAMTRPKLEDLFQSEKS